MELTAEHHGWVQEVLGLDMAPAPAGPNDPPHTRQATEQGAVAPPPSTETKPAPTATAEPTATTEAAETEKMWTEALAQKNWNGAAFSGNAFSKADLTKHLSALSDADKVHIYDSAIDMDLGETSQIVLGTRDAALAAAKKAGEWAGIAKVLNSFGAAGVKAELTRLSGDDVEKLHKAAATDHDLGPNSLVAMATETLVHPVLGSTQSGQAAAKEAKLSPDDQKKYHALLDAAKTPKEKQFITKGLAANHTVAELAAFAKKIAGKDDKWIQDNLSLTGQSDGSGIKQQWHDSCGPTTYEAVQGELDPLYALKMHEDNSKLDQADNAQADKLNPNMAADQKKVLIDGGGTAVARSQSGGRGRWIASALNKVSASTGLTYSNNMVGANPGETSTNSSVAKIAAAVEKGQPVPIVVGQGAGDTHHYVLVTATDPGPPRYFTIHDPWDGKTVLRSEDQMVNGKLAIAGDKLNVLTAFDEPKPVETK